MNNEFANTGILQCVCVAMPAALLAAAHWFPWRKLLGRDLHALETYSLGTSAIVGTASLAIALSNGDRFDHIALLLTATASAGVTTLLAHGVDALVKLYGKVARLEAENRTLKDNGNL